jgi:hypothetical protein
VLDAPAGGDRGASGELLAGLPLEQPELADHDPGLRPCYADRLTVRVDQPGRGVGGVQVRVSITILLDVAV